MNIRYLYRGFFMASLVTFSSICNALIIEGTFSGKVTEAQDGNDGDASFVDVWNGDITGKVVTGSFWYDTSLVPRNTANPNTPNEAIYFSRSNWVGITFNIDGKTFDISYDNPAALPESYIVDVVTLHNHTPAANGDTQEHFGLTDSVERGVEGADFEKREGFVSFVDNISDVLDGVGVGQEFDWHSRNELFSNGTGYFSFFSSVDGQLTFANAAIDISDIHAKARNQVSVPGPSSILLLAGGLLGLVLRKKSSGST